jgi:hypothetical protein
VRLIFPRKRNRESGLDIGVFPENRFIDDDDRRPRRGGLAAGKYLYLL